jgi:hypothetical protein
MAPRTLLALHTGGAGLMRTLLLPTLSIIGTTQALMLFLALALVVVTRVDALARFELGVALASEVIR